MNQVAQPICSLRYFPSGRGGPEPRLFRDHGSSGQGHASACPPQAQEPGTDAYRGPGDSVEGSGPFPPTSFSGHGPGVGGLRGLGPDPRRVLE